MKQRLVAITLMVLVALAGQSRVWANQPDSAELPLDAKAWLLSMNQAMQTRNYQGIATYEHGSELISIAVRHAVIDGVTYERLSHLNDAPREIVRQGEQVSCYHQGQSELRLADKSERKDSSVYSQIDVDDLLQSYTLALLGQQRVAGRMVMVAELKPKDAYRYGRRMFIDIQSKLLLKSIIFDNKRRPLERFQFVQIDIGPNLNKADFASPLAQVSPAVESAADSQATSQAWHLAWMPDGFSALQQPDLAAKAYSDGLAAFTVFVEPSGAQPLAAKLQRGASLVYSRPLMAGSDNYNVTVVGEITLTAAERIAASIRGLN